MSNRLWRSLFNFGSGLVVEACSILRESSDPGLAVELSNFIEAHPGIGQWPARFVANLIANGVVIREAPRLSA
jgi:hypothetical protein